MKEIKNMQSIYEEPELKFIYLTDTDVITTSGESVEEIPEEGEFIPF